jgi:hypothetical protein
VLFSNPEFFAGTLLVQVRGSRLAAISGVASSVWWGRRNYATGISVDQEMAKQMNADGAKPLLLSVGQRSDSIREVISFSAPTEPYVSEVNPAVVYAQLTGILMSSGGQKPTSEADYRLRQGQSVLDLVDAELASFQRLNMSARDRQRVEAWAALVRETEMGLTGMQGGGDATTSCTPAYAEMMGVNERLGRVLEGAPEKISPGRHSPRASFWCARGVSTPVYHQDEFERYG